MWEGGGRIGRDKSLTPSGLEPRGRASFTLEKSARPVATRCKAAGGQRGALLGQRGGPAVRGRTRRLGSGSLSVWWRGVRAPKWKEPTLHTAFRRCLGASSARLCIRRTPSPQKDDAGNTTGTGSIGYRVPRYLKSPLHQEM